MEENNNALQNEELQEDLKPTIFNLSKGDTVFAVGALRAAKFLINKPSGLYDMNNIMDFS